KLLLLLGGHRRDLRLDGPADRDAREALAHGWLAELLALGVVPRLFGEVVERDERRHREELDALAERALLVFRERERAERLALLEVLRTPLAHVELRTLLVLLGHALDALLEEPEIEQQELVVEALLVALRIRRRSQHRVLEAADDMHEHVRVAHGLEDV